MNPEHSQITFEVEIDGVTKRLTKTGPLPVNALISQAVEEFGEIQLLPEKNIEGHIPDPTEDELRTQTIAVLESASHNAGVVLNQLGSMDDKYPMPEVIQQLQEAKDAIDKELETLHG